MSHESYMPIREFARLTGIRRENLRFYDQIGLLSPEIRGKNGYRYYTQRQFDTAFLISDLRAIGVGLEEIKRYAGERSPERMLALFESQDQRIEEEIERLRTMQELMRMRAHMATQALRSKENVVMLEEKEEEPIFQCPLVEKGRTEEDGLVEAYDYAADHGVNLSFPFGIALDSQAFEAGETPEVIQYYFKVRRNHNTWKPGGTYAVFYGQTTEKSLDDFYTQLNGLMHKKGLGIDGHIYMEYALDQLALQNGEPYGVRMEVRVTGKV